MFEKVTIEQEIETVRMGRPHVVVLGAGASRACCPNGDKNDKFLPLMSDFTEKLKLDGLLSSWGIDPNQNFEEIFSTLHENGDSQKTQEIEKIVYNYFAQLELPDNPTIYDHLILSLRKNDVIATFNWDPFLIQAYIRNSKVGLEQPKLLFLHGNVKVGYCKADKINGIIGALCKKCGNPYSASPLLYPIHRKDYATDFFISSEWHQFKCELKNAFMITVFGYSAPKTDNEAISAMKQAWGNNTERVMEQTAFITLQDEEDIAKTWETFIHTHHYEVQNNFYDSWIANHPRRTGEAYLSQFVDAKFIRDNPIPNDFAFPELWEWYKQFKNAENKLS